MARSFAAVSAEINEDALEISGTRLEPRVMMEPITLFSFDDRILTGVGASSALYVVLKRCVDVIICCVALPFLLIPLLVIAFMVRLTSPGPALYREKRIGRFGKPFTIYKFRSMHTKTYLQDVLLYDECEETQMERRLDQKHKRDPRITPIGGFLRKFSLDELPQLLNVLRGDMSLVGPRPVVADELRRYGRYSSFYKSVYPGLSGLWQVSGRSDLSYDRRVQLDVIYCRKWSFFLDLSILARTFPAVLKGKGAY